VPSVAAAFPARRANPPSNAAHANGKVTVQEAYSRNGGNPAMNGDEQRVCATPAVAPQLERDGGDER
jgi:hypothetical protein